MELKDFQEIAVSDLYEKVTSMVANYYGDGLGQGDHALGWTGLHSFTGSGKTVMFAEMTLRLLFGDSISSVASDPRASVLFVADSPDLVEQTRRCLIRHSSRFAGVRRDGPVVVKIENDFCERHSRLTEGHVYLLSRSLLTKGGNLVRGGEKTGGVTFWDVLDTTIREERVHLVMCIDEAHLGFGRKKSDDYSTIVDRLVDGADGRASMPVVIGMTATRERFHEAMKRRGTRDKSETVMVQPAAVKESGLLKQCVNVHTPDVTRMGSEHQLMNEACKMFSDVCAEWLNYCCGVGIDDVCPLFSIQVEDRVDDERLEEICDQVLRNVDFLDPAVSFAHTFGDHEDRVFGKFRLPYIRPEDVQDAKHVRVLLSKEANSNGWNCPRNEVMFSYRNRKDKTYIHQYVGRGLRAVLARRIEGHDILNALHCYLPHFDTENVLEVAREIRDGFDVDVPDDIPIDVFVNPVSVEPAVPVLLEESERKRAVATLGRRRRLGVIGSVDASGRSTLPDASVCHSPEDVFCSEVIEDGSGDGPSDDVGEVDSDAVEFSGLIERDLSFSVSEWSAMRELFESIAYPRRNKDSGSSNGSYAYVRLMRVTRFMVITGLDRDAYERCCEAFANKVRQEFHHDHVDEYKAGIAAIKRFNGVMSQIDIDAVLAGNAKSIDVRQVSENSIADLYTVRLNAAAASDDYDDDCLNAYRRQCDGMDEYSVNCDVAALHVCPSIRKALGDWANERMKGMLDVAQRKRLQLTSEQQSTLDEYLRMSQVHVGVPLTWPEACIVSGDGDLYEHHIVQREDGLFPLKLNSFEKSVLVAQMALPEFVGFYRNPSKGNKGGSVMSVPWRDADGGNHYMHPDFIIFKRDVEGNVHMSVLDPHGIHLNDALPKLKGWVRYLETDNDVPGAVGKYGDVFFEVLSVSLVDNGSGKREARCIDLARQETREAIKSLHGGDSLSSLYRGERSFAYEVISEGVS